MCISFILIQPLHLARTRWRRDGEHARAAVVDAVEGNKRPLLERTPSTGCLHHRSKRKMSHTHTTLPPSYTVHRQIEATYNPGYPFDCRMPRRCRTQTLIQTADAPIHDRERGGAHRFLGGIIGVIDSGTRPSHRATNDCRHFVRDKRFHRSRSRGGDCFSRDRQFEINTI